MTWRSIKDDPPPKDGTWFMIWTHDRPEVGCYDPLVSYTYDPVEGTDTFTRREWRLHDWSGFNNFHAATHWQPIDPPDA